MYRIILDETGRWIVLRPDGSRFDVAGDSDDSDDSDVWFRSSIDALAYCDYFEMKPTEIFDIVREIDQRI